VGDAAVEYGNRLIATVPNVSDIMPIPAFHEILLPLLRRSADCKDWTLAALRGPIAEDFALTDAERAELLPSGTRFANQPCGTTIHLERIDALTRVRRTP